jgi:hypothetical protein
MTGLGMILLGDEAYVTFKPNLIDDHGNIGDESTKKFLADFVDRFAHLVRSSTRAKIASNLPAPSRTKAWASLRLMESRRLLPTITAILGGCVELSMVESLSDKS